MILSGKIIADEIYKELSEKISHYSTIPTLGAVLVGENEESKRYIRQKQKFAQKIGMNFKLLHLEKNISEASLLEEIQRLNTGSHIHGYIVQLPLPEYIDSMKIIEAISPSKDVDGFHPVNQGKNVLGDTSGFLPCTPAGVMKIFEYYNVALEGKHICILGRSNIVGKPLMNLCINAGATVTSCNSYTPNISQFTLSADIVICATGRAHILKSHMVQKKALIIDVGFSVHNGKIYGDADFDSLLTQGNSLTPVPGGVGPMTVAMLLSNTLQAYELQQKK